ncbi:MULTISPECIES: endonuclease III [Nostocales]|uniref:Endonuclease III n=2 Tax=Nostocales TaxID=1161 RepID=A0A0C1QYN4_9CYAN|nr:endonuclease III [Tolypothrix bouteillei]KAF3886618.1 endonuclease III [Tolypothrix bouteillei VB521301]
MPTSTQNVQTILNNLKQAYPNAKYELDWETPLQLLVATILAAQCTDERVNKVTKTLFPKYPTAQAYAEVDILELEEDLKPTGFYRNKAKTVKSMCQDLVERYGGEVPKTMDELVTLPGVARKTANVVLNTAFNMPSGIIVDTHVARVSQRMGLTKRKTPETIEQELMLLVPQEEWTFWGPAVVLHGRYTCTAKKPKCSECVLKNVCEKIGVTTTDN